MNAKIDMKVVVLGSAEVGKTCLTQRFLHGRFREQSATVGAAFGAKKMPAPPSAAGRTSITIGLWDTAGGERFESMSRIYYHGAGAAVVCYDLTSAQTFAKVRFWVQELLQNEPTCEAFIVGTKLDLVSEGAAQRAVPREDVLRFQEQLGVPVNHIYETSAKTGEGIDALFESVVRCWRPEMSSGPDGTVALDGSGSGSGSGSAPSDRSGQGQQRAQSGGKKGCCQ